MDEDEEHAAFFSFWFQRWCSGVLIFDGEN